MSPGTGNYLVYDGECPFCSQYVKVFRLKEAIGPVTLVDARQGGDVVDDVASRGYDLDEGMVMILGDEYYYGADCVHKVAMLSTESGLFNRINGFVFKHRRLANCLYPILKLGRRIVLTVLGRDKIKK